MLHEYFAVFATAHCISKFRSPLGQLCLSFFINKKKRKKKILIKYWVYCNTLFASPKYFWSFACQKVSFRWIIAVESLEHKNDCTEPKQIFSCSICFGFLNDLV